MDAQTAPKKKLAPAGGMLNLQSRGELRPPSQTLTNIYNFFVPSPLTRSCVLILLVTRLDPFADADFGSGSSPSSAQAGAKANASRTGTPKIDDDLGGVAGGKIHIR